jgi:uncharacterized membrane protein
MKQLLTYIFIFFTLTVQAQSFILIESNNGDVYAHGMSSDGAYIAGQIGAGTAYVGHHSFVWTKAGGITEWDTTGANPDELGSTAWGVSLTGRIAGVSPDPNHLVNSYDPPPLPLITAAFRDYNSDTWDILPFLPNITSFFYGFGSRAYAISDDGARIAGSQTAGGQNQRTSAGYWDISNDRIVSYTPLLTNTAPGYSSVAQAISGDGKVIGGQETDNSKNYTVLWIEGVKKRITGVSGDPVNAISTNGRYAVFQNDFKATLYDIKKETFSTFDLGTIYSTPLAVSDNGIVAGYRGSKLSSQLPGGGDSRQAFIYTKSLGMVSLKQFLNDAGIETPLDTLLVASNISADGRKLAGFGTKNGKISSFYVEIPEIPSGLTPVKNIYAATSVYGSIDLSWEAPEAAEDTDAPLLTGYAVYENDIRLTILDTTHLTYPLTGKSDGTYRYAVRAQYEEDGEPVEAIAGKTIAVTIGKKTLPFYEPFDAYMPGGYVVSLGQVMEEIPLSAGYWDVSANTVPFSSSWKVSQSGIPPYAAGFAAPYAGAYSESLTSPYFDASLTADLFLAFEIYVPLGTRATPDTLAVELYDGVQWNTVDKIPAVGQLTNFTNRHYNISSYSGRDNLRFRFRVYYPYDNAGENYANWFIDNIELTDSENKIEIEPPLVVHACKAEDNTVHLNWSDPYGNVTLRYMSDDNAFGFLRNDKLPYIAANRYPAEDLAAYNGYKLTSISFWRTTNPEPEQAITVQPRFKWFVSQGGERLFSADVVDPQLRWNTIQLDEPITVDVSKPLYYGVEVVECDPQDWPIGSGTYYVLGATENDPYVNLTKFDGRGNIYSEDNGATWRKVSQDGADYLYDLFCIRATLSKEPSDYVPRRILGYKIYRNNQSLVAEEWASDISVNLNHFTDTNPTTGNVCYDVKTYYAGYNAHELSGATSDCIAINGIDLIPAANGLKMYPNPVKRNEILRIEFTGKPAPTQTVRIYDLSGKIVQEAPATIPVTSLRVDLQPGGYLLKVNEDETVKLIVTE